MRTITATLVGTNKAQRFYKLSKPITKGMEFDMSIHGEYIVNKFSNEALAHIKGVEVKDTNSWDLFAVSDATTHLERLVFTAIAYYTDENPTIRYAVGDFCHVAGEQGWMFYNTENNYELIREDEEYLKELVEHNGFSWGGLVKEQS